MMKNLGKRYGDLKANKKKGFTLLEIVVVIAIMAILALIMVPNLTAWVQKADDSKVKANMKSVHTAAEMVRQTEGSLNEDRIKEFSNNQDVKVDEEATEENLEANKYTVTNKGGQTVVKYKTQEGKVFTFPDVSNVNNGETGESEDPKPEVIEGSFKWKKYKLTEVVDVKTKDAIGETYLFFNPVFIFKNNLNLEPNALYNVLLSGKTYDTEDQLVDKEYTFNNITSQSLLSDIDNQFLELAEQGGYRIIKKANDPMELVMELIEREKPGRFLVDLFNLFKADEELFLDAYKDYDNIEELVFSLFESFQTKYGFTPKMGDITEAEFLLFLMMTDSSITSNYFKGDYDAELWGEDFKSLTIDLFGHVPELDMGELFMLISIVELANYVDIGDTWAIDIGELSMFSPAYGQSLDRIKIEELQEVGFVNGESGDYPENGEKDGFWYEKVS